MRLKFVQITYLHALGRQKGVLSSQKTYGQMRYWRYARKISVLHGIIQIPLHDSALGGTPEKNGQPLWAFQNNLRGRGLNVKETLQAMVSDPHPTAETRLM